MSNVLRCVATLVRVALLPVLLLAAPHLGWAELTRMSPGQMAAVRAAAFSKCNTDANCFVTCHTYGVPPWNSRKCLSVYHLVCGFDPNPFANCQNLMNVRCCHWKVFRTGDCTGAYEYETYGYEAGCAGVVC
jgi:hypothetical protein